MGSFGKMMTENRISSSNHVGNSMNNQKGFVFSFVFTKIFVFCSCTHNVAIFVLTETSIKISTTSVGNQN